MRLSLASFATLAFPVCPSGRLPRLAFRGLIERLLALRPASSRDHQVTLSIEGSGEFVASSAASIATGQATLPRRDFHPLKYTRIHGARTQLLALAIPFGVVSMAILRRNRSACAESGQGPHCPRAVLVAQRVAPSASSRTELQKAEVPAGMTPFRIRTPAEETAMKLQSYAAWLRFSPLVLAFQVLPATETDTRVIMEGEPLETPTQVRERALRPP